MSIQVERLESRRTPAALYDPAFWGGYDPFPDWAGPVYQIVADVTGPEANGVKIGDDVFYAGEGAGARVKILDGGRHQFEEVNDPIVGPTFEPIGRGDVLYDGLAFGDDTSRFGLVGASTSVAGGRDSLWFGWGESDGTGSGLKPGPVLSRLTFDGTGFTRRESLVLEESYRGAVQIMGVQMLLSPLDVDDGGHPDLLVLPQSGIGGPRLQVLDGVTGDVKRSWFFADPVARPEFAVSPALVGSRVGQFASPPRLTYGLGFDVGGTDVRTELYSWDGEWISTVRPGDPGTEWRL